MNKSSATLPHASSSLWGEISAGEIVLVVAGVVFTIILVTTFVFVMIRDSREKPQP